MICTFVFAYAKIRFSHDAVHFDKLTDLFSLTISTAFSISGTKLVGPLSLIFGVISSYVSNTSEKSSHSPWN